jgi:hypothetical protein
MKEEIMEMVLSTEYLPNNKLLVTFRGCPSCGKTHQLTVDYYAFERYMDGVQELGQAFPELTVAERELFLTGIDGDCYKAMVDQKEF